MAYIVKPKIREVFLVCEACCRADGLKEAEAKKEGHLEDLENIKVSNDFRV